jgi:hypothetical protein
MTTVTQAEFEAQIQAILGEPVSDMERDEKLLELLFAARPAVADE